jgi:hypothetical protein
MKPMYVETYSTKTSASENGGPFRTLHQAETWLGQFLWNHDASERFVKDERVTGELTLAVVHMEDELATKKGFKPALDKNGKPVEAPAIISRIKCVPMMVPHPWRLVGENGMPMVFLRAKPVGWTVESDSAWIPNINPKK